MARNWPTQVDLPCTCWVACPQGTPTSDPSWRTQRGPAADHSLCLWV